MKTPDPFAPLSRKRVLIYSVVGATTLCAAAIGFGSLEGGFSPGELLRTAGIAGIPSLAALTFSAWLSAGKRTAHGVGPAGVRLPVRLVRALPYLWGIIALISLIRLIDLLLSP